MSKITIDKDLYQRATQAAKERGYSSVDELVEHLLEQSINQQEAADDQDRSANDQDQAAVEKRLRGLGYID